jgi:formylglycine-generating enzyme required for sulfatase activity
VNLYYVSGSALGIVTSFEIDNINTIENVKFDIPTEAQWEYAAKGGVKSKGYIYSGSDNLEDVGWTDSSRHHDVKLKRPNELGIYDMTWGMSIEVVKDHYSKYPSSNQTDPCVTNTSGTTFYFTKRGLNNVKRSNYSSASTSESYAFVRLALNWND